MIRGNKYHAQLLCGAAIYSLTALFGAANAESAKFTIPPQPLAQALSAFGQQSGHSMMVNKALVASKTSRGLMASADPEAALKTLLQGTGLGYKRNGEVFVIVAQADTPIRVIQAPLAAASETVAGSAVEGLVVTAQKRREQIQDVPIAISAFSADALQAQKIEGGFDLLKAIPNVTFSKNNFTSYNFSIRGVGTKAISATTDPGVAVAFNSTSLIVNRLFEQEYFDIERVEVLRGPQGTLYGRNATAGVINVISEKADTAEFGGSIKGELGNYSTKRLSGFINMPLIQDVLAVRFAGSMTEREGYDFNSITDNKVNGRDLWSGRLSIGFEPIETIRADFIWERFEEDDNRSRTGKQLCHRDDGPSMVGDETTNIVGPNGGGVLTALFSTGCKAGSLYDKAAFGTPNGLALPFVFGMLALGDAPAESNTLGGLGFNPETNRWATLVSRTDPYGGMMQSPDLRVISSFTDPIYRAKADIVQLNVEFNVAQNLTIASQTAYSHDEVYSFQDFNRFNTQPIFNDTSGFTRYAPTISDPTGGGSSPWANTAPGGIFCDPQVGCSDTLIGLDISQGQATQFSQEFRLQSSYDGPFNFSVGANYTRFSTLIDYYVFYNLITAFASQWPFAAGFAGIDKCVPDGSPPVDIDDPSLPPFSRCIYIDPNPIESINGEGHNYFRSKNPYRLKSAAVFGELYWEVADNLKLTAGVRYTDDRKTFTPVPSQVLLSSSPLSGGEIYRGYPAKPDIEQQWGEWTGRFGVDWKPHLQLTDDTLLYVFLSRGYKGGGANPPSIGFSDVWLSTLLGLPPGAAPQLDIPIVNVPAVNYEPTFKPEFVNAFEVGAKNTLLGGGLLFNATAFFYDYKDYQVSQIRDRTAINENVDGKIWGLEFETVFSPNEKLNIIANLGYLDTKIGKGVRSIDIMNRTAGNPDWIVVKPWVQLPSNCIIPVGVAENFIHFGQGAAGGWNQLCGGYKFLELIQNQSGLLDDRLRDPATGQRYTPTTYPEINGGAGFFSDVEGNELPNSPHWTANIGVQYSWDLFDASWSATVRGDAYWQSQSWARIYNLDPYDKLHGWYNANLSFWIEKPEDDLRIEFYVKNVLDDTPITDAFLNSDDTALTTNVFTLDPRLIGLQITKGF